jgi:hypothetical protein
LGIEMRWGWPRRHARLYRNIRDYAPYIFDLECVVIHEEDAPEGFSYQAHQARQTSVGMFYPLTAYMLARYSVRAMNRSIFAALGELEPLMPSERHVTSKEFANFCKTLGRAKPLPPEPRAEPPTGLLNEDLEAQGFRVTGRLADAGRALLNISWLARSGGHWFFVGILEFRAADGADGGLAGQWRLPGPCGVNHLLRREFEQMCAGLSACLSPAGRGHCLAEIATVPAGSDG